MTLPALTRKAFRDLWHLRGPAVAIGAAPRLSDVSNASRSAARVPVRSFGKPTPGTLKSGLFGSQVMSHGFAPLSRKPASWPGHGLKPVFQIWRKRLDLALQLIT